MKDLTNEELGRISLGYKWNPDMSYDEFCKKNSNLDKDKSYEVYKFIEQRYIQLRYENS